MRGGSRPKKVQYLGCSRLDKGVSLAAAQLCLALTLHSPSTQPTSPGTHIYAFTRSLLKKFEATASKYKMVNMKEFRATASCSAVSESPGSPPDASHKLGRVPEPSKALSTKPTELPAWPPSWPDLRKRRSLPSTYLYILAAGRKVGRLREVSC